MSAAVQAMVERHREMRDEMWRDWVRAAAMVVALFVLVVASVALVALATGCTPTQRQEAKTVINYVLTADDEACIVEHALSVADVNPTTAAIVAVQCGVVPQLLSEVEKLMGASRIGVLRYADGVERREAEKAAAEKRFQQ